MNEITSEKIRQFLDLDLGDNDSGERTARGYLLALLGGVWREGEGFDGKRPFGNSSWEYDLYAPMVRAGLAGGVIDSDGYLETVDDETADALVAAAIAALDAPREDTPGGEPAKVVVVTTEAGREVRYLAPDFGMLTDGTLLIGTRDDAGDVDKITVAASHAPGRWAAVRKDGATAPDGTAVALGIARKALLAIVVRSQDDGEQPFGRPEIGAIARDALEEIWAETEA